MFHPTIFRVNSEWEMLEVGRHSVVFQKRVALPAAVDTIRGEVPLEAKPMNIIEPRAYPNSPNHLCLGFLKDIL